MADQQVHVVALKPLPYNKIRTPNEGFYATKGYADFFIRQGLARLATPDDPVPGAIAATRALVTSTATRRATATVATRKTGGGATSKRSRSKRSRTGG